MGPQIPAQPHAGIRGVNAVSSQHQLPRQPALVGAPANYAPMEPEILSQPSAGVVGVNAVSFQPRLPRQPRFVGASTNYAPMEPQIPSQPQVSVCANSASSEAPTFLLPYANSSPSQPHLSTLPSVLSEFESLVSCENSVSSQSQVGNMYNNPLSSEAQMFSQQYADGNSANSLPLLSSVAFHPEGGNTSVNTAASQYLLASPTDAVTALGNSTTPVSQLSNQPDHGTSPNISVPCSGDLPCPATMENTFGSRCENTFSCQPELRQHISSSSFDSKNISQHGYQGENTLIPSFEDFDFGWETHVSQTNSSGNVYNPKPGETPEVSRHPQLMENTTDLDIQYADWLVSAPSDAPVSTGFNILSPEAPPIDSGFFVDF
uniref:Putative ovule protein n=1 Tax=Solanum chacoense TaxID=4108 RepID=A0A0V0IBF9_SOLCH